MSSVIPGYEYDIFISYRQKDNKYDGWVTEFVNNLKKELEATFKEDVSIYFDENPHDGLLEMHDVDKTLEGKLRSIIFIPIISQTYCDPSSFAWKNEFLVFKRLAQEQGLKVYLSNGNVISRILPIKIHELDHADQKRIEQEIGPLRSIDFIFQAPGVNRPLRASENHEADNLNKTYYRDQINKVANAVKGIVVALSGSTASTETPPSKVRKTITARTKRLGFYFGLTAFLIIAIILSLLPNEKSVGEHASIAILPFRNNTGLPELDYYGVGMASEIRTKLSISKQFDFVSSLQATLPYSGTQKSTAEIGKELNVEYIISGLYQKSGDKIKVEAELIHAESGRVLWALPFERTLDDLFQIQSKIANEIIHRIASKDEPILETKTTSNVDAYAHYIRAKQILDNTFGDSAKISDSFTPVLSQLEKAIQLDSGFQDAWTELISVECFVFMSGPPDPVREKKIRNYYAYYDSRFDDNWQKKLVRGQIAYRVDFNYNKALSLMTEVLAENPDNVHAAYALSAIYKRKLDFKHALQFGRKQIELNPAHGGNWINMGQILELMGDSRNAFTAYLKGWQLSRSKNFAQGLTYHAVMAGFPVDSLPAEIKKHDSAFDFWSMSVNRQWNELKKVRRRKKDFIDVMLAFKALDERDSAIHYAHHALKLKVSDSILCYAVLGDRKKVFTILTTYREDGRSHQEDKMIAVLEKILEVDLLVLLEDYKGATNAIFQINSEFPEFGNFGRFINHPQYDIVFKKYPPFRQALDQVKIPPALNVNEYVKM